MLRLVASLAFLALVLAPFAGARAARADDAPAAAAPVDLGNAVCPVTGKPVTPGITTTADGMTVHFCSKHCAESYAASPKEYREALRKDPAVAKRIDEMEMRHAAAEVNPGTSGLHDGMRKLWVDHVTWTRVFVISALAGLPDKDAATQRLLRNQEDIGGAVKQYFGDDAGTKLTVLLKEHITIAADLVGALKADDKAKAEEKQKAWIANADAIAKFLSDANPTSWPLDKAKEMMREHLDLTTEEVKARLNQDWERDVAAYDKILEQALRMADMLTAGIEAKFPDKVH